MTFSGASGRISSGASGQSRQPVRTLTGLEAARVLYGRGDYAKAAMFCYVLLWKDIRQPEVLLLTGSCLDRLGQRDDAAVYYTLARRAIEGNPEADTPKVRSVLCHRRVFPVLTVQPLDALAEAC